MLNESTLAFLKKLKKNNSKEWFDKNRNTYQESKTDFEELLKEIILALSAFDKSIKDVQPKQCIFRINRDVRFAKDKSPYKTNFGANISRVGKKSLTGYYIHVEPGNSFLAGGCYMPEAPQLSAIRQEIDYNAEEFRKIIGAREFKKYFNKLDDTDKLKLAPKGYPKDHPEIEFLKFKSYIVVHELKDEQLLNKDFVKYCAKVFKALYPFEFFLRRALY